jgi:hypothetical protein
MEKVVRMAKLAKMLCAFIVLVVPAYLSYAQPASAISVELAKKCRELAVIAHPAPTAGSKATGAEKAQRDYYQACIAKGIAGARTQGTGNPSGTGMGGTAATGTGVKTGHGPLSEPIPPAVSTTNPRQNPQQNPQRPQNMQGPAQTNPPQEPFGSR